jgi:hypothetical protein
MTLRRVLRHLLIMFLAAVGGAFLGHLVRVAIDRIVVGMHELDNAGWADE